MYDAQWVLSFNSSSLDFRIDTIGLSVIPGNIPMFEAMPIFVTVTVTTLLHQWVFCCWE